MKKIIRRLKLGKRSLNISTIETLLKKPPAKDLEPYQSRQILHHILGKRRKDEILKNIQIDNKRQYMNALKVYRLRCKS